jgi:CRM1 C terminal
MRVQAVNTHCFDALFQIPPQHQKLVVDAVVWAFKHTERNIAETGLDILLELLQVLTITATITNTIITRSISLPRYTCSRYVRSLLRPNCAVMRAELHHLYA